MLRDKSRNKNCRQEEVNICLEPDLHSVMTSLRRNKTCRQEGFENKNAMMLRWILTMKQAGCRNQYKVTVHRQLSILNKSSDVKKIYPQLHHLRTTNEG